MTNTKLLTPRDWQMQAQADAAGLVGSDGYDSKMVEARRYGAMADALDAPQGCACRWDVDDNRIATCTRHQGWLDVVQEWADRAKDAEAKLAQPLAPSDTAREYMTGYSDGIEWAQPSQALELSDDEIGEIASDLTLYEDYRPESCQADYLDPVKFARAIIATINAKGAA